MLFGVPVFYLYLFATWLAFIGATALLVERMDTPRASPEQDRSDA